MQCHEVTQFMLIAQCSMLCGNACCLGVVVCACMHCCGAPRRLHTVRLPELSLVYGCHAAVFQVSPYHASLHHEPWMPRGEAC
jgi:hypothetical protein